MKFFRKTLLIAIVGAVLLSSVKTQEYMIITNLFQKLYGVFSSQSVGDSDELFPKRGKDSPAETTSASAASGWYCKHMNDGERPPIPSEMSYIEDYGGYYIGEDEKVIYLTFDAGYENGNVEKILDTLKAENVPAAFFILDHLAIDNTDLVKRMFDEGHLVCNHTAKHRDMTKMTSLDDFKAELEAMETVCEEKTGHSLAKYFRPPEGKISEQSLKWANELGYKTIMWSYAYADWDNGNQPSPESAIEKVIAGTHNGEVILLHPTSSANAEILPELIRRWREMGYRFGTLDELTEGNEEK